jgi:prophage tail gpP-like protein
MCIRDRADFETIELTVRGWGQNGRLYAVNTLARVRDDTEVPVLDGVYLITRVGFRRSRSGGTTATLRLVPAGAIQVFPAEAA